MSDRPNPTWAPQPAPKRGLSTWAKVGITIGTVFIGLIIIAYLPPTPTERQEVNNEQYKNVPLQCPEGSRL